MNGTITNASTGGPISGASVQLVDGASTKTTTTDGSGNYSISNVTTGSATVNASMSGFTSASKTVTISANTRVDIALAASTTGGGGTTTSSPVGEPGLPTRTLSGSTNICKLDDIIHPAACINNSFGNATALCQDGARSCSTSNSGTFDALGCLLLRMSGAVVSAVIRLN